MPGQFAGLGALLCCILLLQLYCGTQASPQRAAYSLQAAVDELHRREAAKYPLNAPPASSAAYPHYYGGELQDWDEDNGPPPATSVFRERENQGSGDAHSELTEQFLREIEEASEHERQERYKAALRDLWEKYQQQENEIADDELFEQKKRMRMPPYYLLMQKKRSAYPVLPWLPYNPDKKKRFPVSKRAAKRSTTELSSLGKTDEKVAQELSELFGSANEEKKKRSTDEQQPDKASAVAPTHVPETTATALSDMRLEINFQRVNLSNEGETGAATGEIAQHGHAGHHEQGQELEKERRHRKRSDHAHHSGEEGSDEGHGEHDEHDDEGEESTDEDDHDEFDEDDEADAEERRKKKKRDANSKHVHSPTVGHLMLRAKKSIDWSQYFGLDRKKKSVQETESEIKKRSSTDNSNENVDNEAEKKKKRRDINPEKLESMDKKLQSIEDFIIDETIKYTGAHEGISNQDEIRKLKDHVLSRLATAYSLEKMRRALEKLRQSVENENHLLRNVIEPESEENTVDNYWTSKKRLSVKKDQADDNEESVSKNSDADVKKMKKRGGYLRYPEQPNTMEDALTNSPFEPLNDAYLGNKNYIIGSNQCPMIESMAERCRGVDLISGDLNQELLPLCGVHQICYLCGASQVACDYQYLAEADSVCGSNNDCQAAARSVLMILRGTPGPQLGPRECLKNPCLYSAMREIGL
ncbi:myb-like protein X isoform X2 [Scaptodrosophila lebanonensis]|uniref:Myb-like protein X isoform X2 n=1 Tax=Drosophila lebanonensis TaxID=7225 RepID=A0A6J2UIV0_DROLE|nr:myb-like protein X isoform X2 [Scaptodrosophila lebanonensis]